VEFSESEPLQRAIFGTTTSRFVVWSKPWGVAQLLPILKSQLLKKQTNTFRYYNVLDRSGGEPMSLVAYKLKFKN